MSVPTSSVSNNGAMNGSVFFMAVYEYRVQLSPGVGVTVNTDNLTGSRINEETTDSLG